MKALQSLIPADVLGGDVRCLQFSNFTFDVFIQDLFYTWGVGGTVISSTREIMLGSFPQLANATKATHAHLTPAFAASIPRERCKTLEVVTMIGERLSQVVADDWSMNMRAFNTYGPAECTVVSTLRRFGAPGDEMQSENIGYPLPSVSAFVVRNGQPVMRHCIGELALGGPQLSNGYFHDHERSAERFVWNKIYKTRLYLSGDMARQLHDGSFEFVGRTDDLIKIQGIRIELSEISYALRSCHPLVRQVETQYLARDDRPSRIIVTFLAAPKLDTAKTSNFRPIASKEAVSVAASATSQARTVLPSYMVPSLFIVIGSIPHSPSAKIDQKALLRIYSLINLEAWESNLASHDGTVQTVMPWSHTEYDVLGDIANLSGTARDSITRWSELRSIGIDSIAVAQLVSVLHRRGASISIADLLHCQTVDALLQVIKRPSEDELEASYDLSSFHNRLYKAVKIHINRSNVFVTPALPFQESLLSESMRNVDSYWSHVCLTLDPQVDLHRLRKTWQKVVDSTEALRTGFIPSRLVCEHPGDSMYDSKSSFLQLIYDKAVVVWNCVEISKDYRGSDLASLCRDNASRIAKNHQQDYFRSPSLAITIFISPSEGRTMMVSSHHAVRDEASLGFILQDVLHKYQNLGERQRHQFRQGLQAILPTENTTHEDEIFWSKTLRDFAVTDNPNVWPSSERDDSMTHFITCKHNLTSGEKELRIAALSLGASSVASLLQVAWGAILLMYLERETIVFAETWSHRTGHASLSDVIGPLITVLPVPFRVFGSVRDTVYAQTQLQQQCRAHASVHPRVIKKLIGNNEGSSLYPALFNFLPNVADEAPDHLWTKAEVDVGLTVEHPMALNASLLPTGGLEIEFVASTKIMNPAKLNTIARQVDGFVMKMLKFPDLPLMQLPSHFSKECLSVSSVSFSEEVKLAHKQSPTHWVDYYARTKPHWLAVEVVDSLSDERRCESWNYEELRSAYCRIAAFLKSSGHVRRMIAVCLDRRIEFYAIILGILTSGNIYLPIEEDLPEERKNLLLEDSSAALLFTTESLAMRFSNIPNSTTVVCVNDVAYMHNMRDIPQIETAPSLLPTDNAYLLYTSGSTGLPKGVLVGRGNLCSFIEGLSEYIRPRIPSMQGLPGKGRYLGLASRAFDVHIAEMFLAWRDGLAAVTAPRNMLLDDLESALQNLRITHASFVPSLIDQAGLDPAKLPDLHYLGVGGEKMSKCVADVWASNHNAALINAYGPTELSIGCTAVEMTAKSGFRNVGQPYGTSVAHVLVPGTNTYTLRGVSGELCFTGDLVANGYHNRPDAHGFVDFNGERMYRTGDIARLMPDDSVEYLGRKDDQVKVRGQRLELGEVTETIRWVAVHKQGFDKVDVATLITQHPGHSKLQIISFLAGRLFSQQSNTVQILKTAKDDEIAQNIKTVCQTRLPAYMVPDWILPLTKLPLAPSSGKADVKQLRDLFAGMTLTELMEHDPARQLNESNYRALTESEMAVRSAISKVLEIDVARISARSSLYELGLDSLSAISLAVEIQKLGYNCSVSEVMRTPVVEDLACLSQERKALIPEKLARTRQELAGLEIRYFAADAYLRANSDKSLIEAVRPCTPLQETLVAASLGGNCKTLYVNTVRLQLAAGIDVARLHDAWNTVVAQHEILRTCFQEFEDRILQIVLRYEGMQPTSWTETSLRVPDLDLESHTEEPTADIISHIREMAPVRLTMLQSSSAQTRVLLILHIHHALYDAVSLKLMFEHLESEYYHHKISPFTPFTSIIEYIYSQDHCASKVFWEQYLANYQPISITEGTFKRDMRRDNEPFSTLERTSVTSLDQLSSFSSSINGTLSSTVSAVFGVALAQTLKVSDVVFGSVFSGRTLPIEDPQNIMGPCITTIPQRVCLNAESTCILDAIREAQRGFANCLDHQHTALRDIHRWVGAQKSLFDCLTTYVQKMPPRSEDASTLWTEVGNAVPDDFPLSVEFEADFGANQFRVHCSFIASVQNTVTNLTENFDLLLGALVRREEVTRRDLDLTEANADHMVTKRPTTDESSWTPTQAILRNLASQICGISTREIRKEASFFSLGIDSIIAIRFARGIRDTGTECSSAEVMRYSSIATLAEHLDTHSSRSGDLGFSKANIDDMHSIPIVIAGDTVTDVYRCTPLQSSMLTQTLGSAKKLYTHHHIFSLSDDIDLAHLRHAWKRLVMMTDILRTTFHFSSQNIIWMAALHSESSDSWVERSIDGTVADELNEITGIFQFSEEADFERPPWKTHIVKNISDCVLVISMHHSLYDGDSIQLLWRDLADLYRNLDPPSRKSFGTAAKTIAANAATAETFWMQKLEGFENSQKSLPSDVSNLHVCEVEATLRLDIEEVLQGCKHLGVTLQTVALLAFGKSLACCSKRRDVVFGHVVSGRSLTMPGIDEVVGPLFNTVPFRLTLGKTYATNESTAAAIQEASGESQPYQHASLSKIQHLWRQRIGDPEAQLLDSLFVFENSAERQLGSNGLWKPVQIGGVTTSTEHANNFRLEQRSDTMTVSLASLVRTRAQEQRLEAWLEDFQEIFEDILKHPQRSVLAFPSSLQGLPLNTTIAKNRPDSQPVTEEPAEANQIRNVLSEISRIPKPNISMHASIFSIGLDSISAIKVAAMCRINGLDVSVADVLQGQSLGGICDRIRRKGLENESRPEPSQGPLISQNVRARISRFMGVDEESIENVLPCLPGQLYHLANWLKSDRTMGEAVFAYECSTRLDKEQLASAWMRVREHHSILRTAFAANSSKEVFQTVFKPSALTGNSLRVVDSGTPENGYEKELEQEASQSFDLFSPPVRATLVPGDTRDYLLLKLHHAVYDAWTVHAIIKDLASIYHGSKLSASPSLKSFIGHITPSIKSEKCKGYWQRSLNSSQQTLLQPFTPVTPDSAHTNTSTSICFKFAIPNLQTLETLCRLNHITLPTLLLLAFARTLARHTSVQNPTFGLYQTGRSASFEGIENICAPCLNVTPVVVPAALDAVPLESMTRLQEDLAARVDYEQSRLSEVLEWMGDGDQPLFNSYVNILSDERSYEGLKSTSSSEKPLFIPIQPDENTLNMASKASSSKNKVPTAVDALETDYLAAMNLYLDIVKREDDDCIDLAIKCHEELMDEGMVRAFAREIGAEVERIVGDLNG